ncbi:MAG: arginine--tRNA ligase [Lachnospiraceae bacterium]|nr:arginine--tRNA ligase [Lachnospiraceae bacterium]
MKKLIDLISDEIRLAFDAAGYDASYGQIVVSNRPDLCQFQCNGALSAAKAYKKAPIMIANDVLGNIKNKEMFGMIEAVMPGFINIRISDSFLNDFLVRMYEDERLGAESADPPKKIVVDYGGPNVAKPLHVGHLRSAVIGESIKRILRFLGNEVIGDAHLGDWGLQIGLIITELKERKPGLPYFDEGFEGEYPKEAPFTMSELEDIYPTANGKSKEDEAFKEAARHATFELQNGRRGYRALWKHIMEVSIADLEKNYEKLNVHFDVWGKESDAQPYIADMVQGMKDGGFAHISDGALVVDVKEDTDTKEMPPCMILKSDGATLYNTTDLATIVERVKKYDPDYFVYLADVRQSLYFEQVFRCARKTGLVRPDVKMTHLGFGTMNGKDGKAFKTRSGGVMRLEYLINDVTEEVKRKMSDRDMSEEEIGKIAGMVGLAAIKYGDLSNQPTKDYIFDIDRFTSFEGNTGPYILYTMVRIKSILARCKEEEKKGKISKEYEIGSEETELRLKASAFADAVELAANELAPNKICQYIYELANALNAYYHANRILTEENEKKKASWIALLILTLRILEKGIELLAFEAPDRM